ncbi:MAG: stage III sporulation protein AC [Clostridia bacterium]|nr:stage III sporulation protein AC [Clostridia bacterium]
MDFEMVLKIGALGILITIISQVLSRAGRDDIATLATLAGLIVVMVMVLNMVSDFFNQIRAMFLISG